MALQTVRLPRLDTVTRLVDASGVATATFARWWEEVASQIETSINAINEALEAAGIAQTTADGAQTAAANAQTTADDANTLAGTKVTQDVGPAWTAPTGTEARTALASYVSPVISNPPTQAEVQAVSDALQAVSQASVAIITDLRGNHALTP